MKEHRGKYMDYTTKLVYQSNYWYNDGLSKANIRDLTGAITSLKKSLQYNRDNIASRNLLGLVYYGRGDVVEALTEWVLSKNLQPKENIANYYIKKVKEKKDELEQINQAIKRYNQALDYCYQRCEDLAVMQLKKAIEMHPTYVKAYQLLALLYIMDEQYSEARKNIRIAHKLDKTDDITMRYMHELNQVRKARNVRLVDDKDTGKKKRKGRQTVTYNIGNETIIQPVASGLKDNVGLHTMVNIAIGVIVGVAVMGFLIMPAVSASKQSKLNKQTVKFSDQIATQKSQISALKKELETYRTNSKEAKSQQQTAEVTKSSYESLMTVVSHSTTGDMSNSALAEELLKINADTLGTSGKEEYDALTQKIYPKVCVNLYATAQKNYQVANYDTAVTNLEQIVQMDEGYQDGAAMLLLAQSYEKQGNQDKANTYYQKIIEKYDGTEAATEAQNALDTQNSQKSKTDNN